MRPGLSLAAAAPSSVRLVEVGARADCCGSSGCGGSGMATVFQVNYGMGRAVWRRSAGEVKGRRGRGAMRGVVECVQGRPGAGHAIGNGQRPIRGTGVKIFDVEDPRGNAVRGSSSGTFDVNMAWELLRQDVLYLDWKARQDVLAIVTAHDKVRIFGLW